MLFGFLFGEESTQTKFERTGRRLLTITIPRMKSDALDFMKATTELRAAGTWQDPKDETANTVTDNVVLEINEEVLYGRVEKVEQSTLVS